MHWRFFAFATLYYFAMFHLIFLQSNSLTVAPTYSYYSGRYFYMQLSKCFH